MKTITFYSYKGGVGRTLALANIAIRLAEFNRKVCLLDFDLEAPGLHYKFPSFNHDKMIKKGLVDYIYNFAETGTPPNALMEYSYEFQNAQVEKLISIIPAGDANTPKYWKMLSAINWYELLYENPQGLSFLLDLKEKIKKEINPDFLLIDSRTGISEVSGITLSLLADDVVIVAANNKENLDGSKRIVKSLLNPDNRIIGAVPKITFVLSRIPFTEKPEDKTKENNLISKIKKDFGGLIDDVNVIHSDRELEENEQIKIGYKKDETVAQISRDYLNLFEKLTLNDLAAWEITKFRDIKDSEWHFQKIFQEDSLPKQLDHINKAIEFNSANTEFYIYRALIYNSLGQKNKAIEDCDFVLAKDSKNIYAHQIQGSIYIDKKDYAIAKNSYQKILEIYPDDISGYLGIGHINSITGNFEEAVNAFSKAIEIDPNSASAYNSRGNALRLLGKYESALNDVYKALELNPEYAFAFATLAEINAHLGNDNEFYLNIENALKIDANALENAITTESIYKKYFEEDRFIKITDKYNILLKKE